MPEAAEVTRILQNINIGSKDAYDQLFPLIYDQLRDIAQRHIQGEKAGHTYSRTDLVHEAYFKLINVDSVTWQDRAHFYAIASKCIRQILIDYARKKRANKRGGKNEPVTYIDEMMEIERQADNLIDLDRALEKLEKFNERLVQVVECRYFGEMTIEDTAAALELSPSTVKRDWAKARGFLYQMLKNPTHL